MFRKARLLKGDIRGVTTNTVEGYYSIFKRGMKGVHQHCAEKHLHRYLSEFDVSSAAQSYGPPISGVDVTEIELIHVAL